MALKGQNSPQKSKDVSTETKAILHFFPTFEGGF